VVVPLRPVTSSRIQSNGSSASLLQASQEDIASCARRIVAVPKARIWMVMLILIKDPLNLSKILRLRQRQHHQDSGVRRQHSFDCDKLQ
jgi:hypothetical protein